MLSNYKLRLIASVVTTIIYKYLVSNQKQTLYVSNVNSIIHKTNSNYTHLQKLILQIYLMKQYLTSYKWGMLTFK